MSVPRGKDAFRRHINAGLQQHGHDPVWRPDGAGGPDGRPTRGQLEDRYWQRARSLPWMGTWTGSGAQDDPRRVAEGTATIEQLTERRAAVCPTSTDVPLRQNGPPRRHPLGTVVTFVPPPGISDCNRSPLPEQLASSPPTVAPTCIQAPPIDRSDRRGGTWQPARPFEEAAVRRRMYRLRDGLRCVSRPRIRACGYAAITPRVAGGRVERQAEDGSVGVVVDGAGVARMTGLAHCGSVWECPVCQMKIKCARSEEVQTAVETHGRRRVAMLTLTVRHGIGHDLRHAREVVSAAWRATMMGAASERFKRSLGVWGSIRALEVTHGPNGWHPHLHILLFLDDELPAAELLNVADEDDHDATHKRWIPPQLSWLIARWRKKVASIDAELEPSSAHAVTLSPISGLNYITKLGLELADPGHKSGRRGNRTPLDIAHDFVELGQARDAALWREYCAGMKGAKFLTWSRGLKRSLGIASRSDAEIAHYEEEPTERIIVGRIERYAWQYVRDLEVDTKTVSNCDGTVTDRGLVSGAYWLLEQCERGGSQALQWALLQLATGEVGRPLAERWQQAARERSRAC